MTLLKAWSLGWKKRMEPGILTIPYSTSGWNLWWILVSKNKSVAILWFPGAFLSNILIRPATLLNFWTPNRVKLLMKNFGWICCKISQSIWKQKAGLISLTLRWTNARWRTCRKHWKWSVRLIKTLKFLWQELITKNYWMIWMIIVSPLPRNLLPKRLKRAGRQAK